MRYPSDERMSRVTPSQRQLRAGELIRHALADILLRGETGDPELEALKVSVHEVQVSPDLKIATAYVSTLAKGGEERALGIARLPVDRRQRHHDGRQPEARDQRAHTLVHRAARQRLAVGERCGAGGVAVHRHHGVAIPAEDGGGVAVMMQATPSFIQRGVVGFRRGGHGESGG